MIEWKKFEKTNTEYHGLRNKNTLAVYVTKENCKDFLEECRIFDLWDDDSEIVCTGFMSLRRLPFWVMQLNPRGKKKFYRIEDDVVFKRNFKEKDNV